MPRLVFIIGASTGIDVDSAIGADLGVISHTFATNNIGMAATFYPFITATAGRGGQAAALVA